MTRAACNLILQLATARHCWRTIQALKQSHYSSQHDPQTQAFFLSRDTSLLHLWALLAFHTVYVQTGLETLLSLFPFYYYIKLILILITVQPETGFSKYWFDILLVPLMDHIHSILDMDWKSFIRQEVVLFPYTLLHMVLFPGIFTTVEESVEQQTWLHGDDYEKAPLEREALLVLQVHDLGEETKVPLVSTPSIQKKYRYSLESAPFIDGTNRLDDTSRNGHQRRPSSHSKLSEKIREFVVGDKTIRLRDYLFDLNLPALPSPRPVSTKDKSPPRHAKNRPSSKLRSGKVENRSPASPERPKSRSRRDAAECNETPLVRRSRRIASINHNTNL
jgi:hypothetical protein